VAEWNASEILQSKCYKAPIYSKSSSVLNWITVLQHFVWFEDIQQYWQRFRNGKFMTGRWYYSVTFHSNYIPDKMKVLLKIKFYGYTQFCTVPISLKINIALLINFIDSLHNWNEWHSVLSSVYKIPIWVKLLRLVLHSIMHISKW
jgi:hypothetical protein